MKKKIVVFGLASLVPLLIALFYFSFYNATDSLSIQCTFHQLTGMQCPGCGGQRALSLLLHGEILSALRYNVVFIVGLPVILYIYYVMIEVHFFKKTEYINGFVYSSRFAKLALIAIVAFFVLRNIPYEPFIYLSPPQ